MAVGLNKVCGNFSIISGQVNIKENVKQPVSCMVYETIFSLFLIVSAEQTRKKISHTLL